MSIKIMTAVWSDSKANGNDLLLLLSLADQANDEGWCWPSVKTMATRSRQSERTVQRAVKRLVDLGELVVVASSDGVKSNRYRVLLGCQSGGGVKLTGVTQPCHQGGDTAMTPGGDTAMTPEPSRTVKESSITNTPEEEQWFENLWNDYPHYGGKTGGRSSKTESLKVFRSLKPDQELMKRIWSRLQVAKKSKKWTDDGGQYVDSMQKWLREASWNDFPSGEIPEQRVIRRGNYTFNQDTGELVDKYGRKMTGELQPSGIIKTSSGTFIDLEGKEKS